MTSHPRQVKRENWPRMSSATFRFETLTVQQVARRLEEGSFTVTDLVQSHLDRIKLINPEVRAVLQVNPNALSTAAALDEEIKRSGRRG